MKIKAALIDLDDTICNSTPLYKEALRSCLEVFNLSTKLNWSFERFNEEYDLVKKEVALSVPSPTAEHNRALYFQKMVEQLEQKSDFDLAYNLYQTYYNYLFLNLRLFPEAEELLSWLAESHRKVVVVSDGNAHIRLKKIHALGISKYIDYVVSSEEAGMKKPAMQPFLIALQKAKVSPNEAIMLGNSATDDIFGANRLGITTILTNESTDNSLADLDQYEKPKYTVKNLMKVKDIIEYLENN